MCASIFEKRQLGSRSEGRGDMGGTDNGIPQSGKELFKISLLLLILKHVSTFMQFFKKPRRCRMEGDNSKGTR